ncbi:DUF721 domain-containing protein [candidate division TA06 bacterium]|uniref:DUF721 domain-containing protein n=1 Tax=candidate division TA06 bacterium TaxID=2250710 RepID=A0A933IA94_UNCT6|nr:DUF721 domain-containing protein [candidate division TA06 bacterium]
MAHPNKPESVGPILDRLLKNLEIDKKVGEGQALLIWPEAAGPKMAAKTRPESVFRGRMTVLAQNPAWGQECMFMRIQIRDKLNKMLGREIIKEIVFKVGEVDNSGKQ